VDDVDEGVGLVLELVCCSFLRRISSRALSHDDCCGVVPEAVEKLGGGAELALDEFGFCHAPAFGVDQLLLSSSAEFSVCVFVYSALSGPCALPVLSCCVLPYAQPITPTATSKNTTPIPPDDAIVYVHLPIGSITTE